MFSVRLTLSE